MSQYTISWHVGVSGVSVISGQVLGLEWQMIDRFLSAPTSSPQSVQVAKEEMNYSLVPQRIIYY